MTLNAWTTAHGASPSIEVAGTSFRVSLADGRVLTSPDLVGAVLRAADESGAISTIRIDAVTRDPGDAGGDVWLHRFSTLDPATGTWRETCRPGPDGMAAGFPLAGEWDKGRHIRSAAGFIIACTSGAIGKCVRYGYKPWLTSHGQSLWDFHQACVRMVRADYGGDGTAHTRDGARIDLFDGLGIQKPEPDRHGLTFEAAWGPDGAVCVRHTRVDAELTLAELMRRYPRFRPADPSCSETTPAMIWDRS
jgi:hypothetical protein